MLQQQQQQQIPSKILYIFMLIFVFVIFQLVISIRSIHNDEKLFLKKDLLLDGFNNNKNSNINGANLNDDEKNVVANQVALEAKDSSSYSAVEAKQDKPNENEKEKVEKDNENNINENKSGINENNNMNKELNMINLDNLGNSKEFSKDLEIKPLKQRWITFEIFPGRLNNQLITLDWVLRTTMAFNRTVFIEDPLHDQTWLGIGLGRRSQVLWDVSNLQNTFRVAFEEDFIVSDKNKDSKEDFLNFFERELESQLIQDGVNTKLIDFKNNERVQLIVSKARAEAVSILKKKVDSIPPHCIYDPNVKNVVKFMLSANKNEACQERIHFQTGGGLVHPWKSDTRVMNIDPLIFWRSLKPAQYLIQEAKDFIEKKVRNNIGDENNIVRKRYQGVRMINDFVNSNVKNFNIENAGSIIESNSSTNPKKKNVVAVHTRAHNSYLEPPPAPKAYERCDRIANKLRKAADDHVNALYSCCKNKVQDDHENGLSKLEKTEESALVLLGWSLKSNILDRNRLVNKIYEEKKMKDMCHLTPYILNLAKNIGRLNTDGIAAENIENHVILCTDKELPDVDKMFYDAGAVSYKYSLKYFNEKRDAKSAIENKDSWMKILSLVSKREEVLMDMLIMTFSDIFIGAPSSTLSFVVCMWRYAWRGMERQIPASSFENSNNFGEDYQPNLDMICPLAILATGTSDCSTIHCED